MPNDSCNRDIKYSDWTMDAVCKTAEEREPTFLPTCVATKYLWNKMIANYEILQINVISKITHGLNPLLWLNYKFNYVP